MTKEQIRQRLLGDLADEGYTGIVGTEDLVDCYAGLLSGLPLDQQSQAYDVNLICISLKLAINECKGRNCYRTRLHNKFPMYNEGR